MNNIPWAFIEIKKSFIHYVTYNVVYIYIINNLLSYCTLLSRLQLCLILITLCFLYYLSIKYNLLVISVN